MSYKLLKAFHAICITGSISKAADHLCLTQPAVSIALRKLEKNYAVSLVTRHGPKIELTEDGKALQLLVSTMFDAESSVIGFLQSGETLDTGLLTVASDGPVLPLKLLALFRKNHPGIVLNIRFGNNMDCWNALMRREVDLALIARSGIPDRAEDHVIMHSVRQLGISAIFPKTHPLANQGDLCLKDLMKQPLLFRETGSNTQSLLSAMFVALGETVTPVAVLSSREAIMNAVVMGLGVGFALDDEAEGYRNIISIPITELRNTSEDVVVALPAAANRKVVRTAFDFVQGFSSETTLTS